MSEESKKKAILELETRIKELAGMVGEQEFTTVLPPNIAATIADRMDLEFSPVANYEKGGTYTKEGPPDSYTKGGTYTKSDFTKETGDLEGLKGSGLPGRDLIIQPGEIEGLDTPLKVSSVLRHPEVRERLRNVIEAEVKGFKK